MIKPSEVVFVNDKIERAFYKLDDKEDLKKNLVRAVKDLRQNAFSGIQIPKRLIPREYSKKYRINNLWKYNLPDGWRLIYTLSPQNKVEILSVIIEWFKHKEYNRRFNYIF